MQPQRLERVRRAMADRGVDVLLLSVGADLPYLVGYEAMPLERLTMLVVPRDGDATLVVPRLEAPRVRHDPGSFELVAWGETEDPIQIVLDLAGHPSVAAVGDQMWAGFLVDLMGRMPGTAFRRASEITGPLRAVKDAEEVESLRRAARAADRVAAALQAGEVPLLGRREADVSSDLGRRLVAEGHDRVNFAIVASGPNGASPHHEPGDRVIEPGDVVLCDFGGTMRGARDVGYCSDISRCVQVGEPSAEVTETYAVLREAQEAAVAAAQVGAPCEQVDRVARRIIAEAGLGERFIHRTGHGIGVEAHEQPYLVEGNPDPLRSGNAFSVEPGIYLPGRFGLRLEDIVVATDRGPDPLNRADHALAVVEA